MQRRNNQDWTYLVGKNPAWNELNDRNYKHGLRDKIDQVNDRIKKLGFNSNKLGTMEKNYFGHLYNTVTHRGDEMLSAQQKRHLQELLTSFKQHEHYDIPSDSRAGDELLRLFGQHVSLHQEAVNFGKKEDAPFEPGYDAKIQIEQPFFLRKRRAFARTPSPERPKSLQADPAERRRLIEHALRGPKPSPKVNRLLHKYGLVEEYQTKKQKQIDEKGPD